MWPSLTLYPFGKRIDKFENTLRARVYLKNNRVDTTTPVVGRRVTTRCHIVWVSYVLSDPCGRVVVRGATGRHDADWASSFDLLVAHAYLSCCRCSNKRCLLVPRGGGVRLLLSVRSAVHVSCDDPFITFAVFFLSRPVLWPRVGRPSRTDESKVSLTCTWRMVCETPKTDVSKHP